MVGTLAAATVLFVLLFAFVQFALVWAGHGAVETAVHFAARRFAVLARTDCSTAQRSALEEAVRLCRNRPGGSRAGASLTALDFSRDGRGGAPARANAGEAYRVRLTHWVELAVPWVNRILFAVAPIDKAILDERYYLCLRSTRWVTVE